MKYIRDFESIEEARAAGLAGLDSPHFSIVEDKPARNYKIVEGEETFIADFDDNGWIVEPQPTEVSVGDIVYMDGSDMKTVPLTGWTSQGTPIGVVAIPPDFLSDGIARMISIENLKNEEGDLNLKWGDIEDSQMDNFPERNIWNNDASSPQYQEWDGLCAVPSNLLTFTGDTCACDSKVNYYYSVPTEVQMIPSPYLEDGTFNPEYYATLPQGNALGDLEGILNTGRMKELVANSEAYTAVSKYETSGTAMGDWYIPAMGELGITMARLKEINKSLKVLGGSIYNGDVLLSSTENGEKFFNSLVIGDGQVYNTVKTDGARLRAFHTLE